jgi:hypothetical protein
MALQAINHKSDKTDDDFTFEKSNFFYRYATQSFIKAWTFLKMYLNGPIVGGLLGFSFFLLLSPGLSNHDFFLKKIYAASCPFLMPHS